MARNKPKSRTAAKAPHRRAKRKANDRRAGVSPSKRVVQQNIVGRRQAKEHDSASERLLLAITRAQSLWIDEAQPTALCEVLLQELLTLTESEYGLIGEVDRTAEGQPFLRAHAMTDIAWNEETTVVTAQKISTLELSALKTLLGHVMTTGKPVIANDPAHDPRAGGLPPGDSPMHAWLGLPVYRGELLAGVVGIANRPGGYDESFITYLKPFLSTCAQLLDGYRHRRLRAEAEAGLRLSEERWQLAVQGSYDGIWDWDLASNQVYFSPRWKEILGHDEQEILNDYQEWESRLHPEDRARVISQLTDYLEHRSLRYQVEFRLRKKNGEYCWVQARGKAMWNAEGRPYRMAGFHTDITDRKREEVLQAAEKQALELVAKEAGLPDVLAFICRTIEAQYKPMRTAIMLVTEDGAHLRCVASPSLPEEYNRAVDGISIGPTVGSCGSAAYYGKPSIVTDIEQDLLWKDYVQLTRAHGLRACWSQPILSSTGAVLGTFAAYYTEPQTPSSTELAVMERAGYLAAVAIQHIKLSEALRESEARFQAFMAYSPAVSFIKDAAGRHLYINPTFERLFGFSLSEIRGKTLDGRLPDNVVAQLRVNDEQVLTSGQPIEVEETVPTPDGKSQHWLVLKFPLTSLFGERLLGGVAIDITERKLLERASQDQANRLRLAMDIAGLATWDWNILTNQVTWSDNCEQVKSLPEGSFDGTFEVYQRLVHPEDLPRLQADIERALSGQQPYHTEHRIVPPTGEVQWIEWNGEVYRDELGRPIRMVGTARNITKRKYTEQAMLVNEERYARATAVGGVGVWELDVRAGTYYGDRNLKAMFGYQPDELSADPFAWLNLVHPDDQSMAMAHWQRIVNREADDYSYELRMIRKDGTVIWTDIRGHAVRDVDGQVTHLIGATVDITVRKQVQESLQRTQFAMDQAVDAVYWIDPHARILYANEAASAMLGYTKEEFLCMTVHDLNPDFPPDVWPGWWAETREKKVMSLETVHLTKDGRRIPIDIRVSFLAYGGQEFHCAYVRDISERKRVDEALRASQERFELAAHVTHDGIWDWNILTGDQYWSDRHLELCGLEPRAITSTYAAWILLVHPDDADRVHQATCRHLETREPYDLEMRVRMKDGRYRWFRDRGQALWDTTGRPVRMVGSISDVTEQRNAEEALRNAHAELEQRVVERTSQLEQANRLLQDEITERKRVEDRLQTTQYAVDHAADQIFIIGSDGFFLDVNESACSRLGYTKAELLTMSVMDIDPDFPSEKWSEFWARFAQEGQFRLETRHRAKSGEIYPVEVVANYLFHNGQELDYAVVRDITERKQAEAAVLESELRYKLLTEATFDGIAIHDQGTLLEVNRGLERMFGYESGELVGRPLWDLVSDESRDLVLTNMRSGVNGPYEVMGRRKDGSTFPGEVVVRPYRYRGTDVRLVAGRDITERKHLEMERTRHTAELERQVVERTAEIARLESHRVQAERLAALGRLAAGVAHEINNPIAGIKNAFELVKQAVDPAHAQYEFVGMIDREIARVSSIVQNMYQLYRQESGKVEAVDLRTMIGDIKALFAKQLQQRRLTLVVEAAPQVYRLDAPRSDLLQVLLNLLNNAIDCSREGGTITITIHEEAEVICIAVADHGSGISPEVVPHIFDPFFTTKTEGEQKGMGLGLSISQSLVAAMGGRIDVHTQFGQGSTFSVLLPCHRVAAYLPDPTHTNKEVVTHGC